MYMNQKLLWKIEELWNKYFLENKQSDIDISDLYKNCISIHNSDFHMVEQFNFSESGNIVHSDEYGKYHGLEKSQISIVGGKLVYVFDNHNKILQPFLEYFELVGESFDAVQIDAHNDNAVFPQEKPLKLELKKVREYIEQTRISDFFDFLFESKIIDTIHRYTKSSDFEIFKKPEKPYVLSLDIDIFGPEGDFTDIESKIKIIADAWFGAEMVCIAMSPGFIHQGFANDIISIFTKK